MKLGWKYEGIGWYSDTNKSVPLYRQYNPNAKSGSHNYTTNKAENDMLVNAGWKAEGVAWYGLDTEFYGRGHASDVTGKYGVYLEMDERAYVFYDNDVRVTNSTVSFYGRTYTADSQGHLDMSNDDGMRASIEAVKLLCDGQTHEYSNTNRLGPSYDCSSIVLISLKNAGVDVGNATYTGDMEKELTAHGYRLVADADITSHYNFRPGMISISTGKNSHAGDHAIMYLGQMAVTLEGEEFDGCLANTQALPNQGVYIETRIDYILPGGTTEDEYGRHVLLTK